MRQYLEPIGVCAIVYAAARLIHYLSLLREDNATSEHSSIFQITQTLLVGLVIILGLLSLPVSFPLGLIERLHTNRMHRLHESDLLAAHSQSKAERDQGGPP